MLVRICRHAVALRLSTVVVALLVLTTLLYREVLLLRYAVFVKVVRDSLGGLALGVRGQAASSVHLRVRACIVSGGEGRRVVRLVSGIPILLPLHLLKMILLSPSFMLMGHIRTNVLAHGLGNKAFTKHSLGCIHWELLGLLTIKVRNLSAALAPPQIIVELVEFLEENLRFSKVLRVPLDIIHDGVDLIQVCLILELGVLDRIFFFLGQGQIQLSLL